MLSLQRKVVVHHFQQRADGEVAHMDFELARLHARDIEQAGEDGVLRCQ